MSKSKRRHGKPGTKGSTAEPAAPASGSGRGRWLLGLALLAAVATVVYFVTRRADEPPAAPVVAPAPAVPAGIDGQGGFVGAATCAGCHATQASQWQASQHAHAMDHATDDTVRGDFGGVRFTNHGLTSTFFRRDGRFFVNTDGPDGQPADFEVKYVFGLEPLQQYLIAFPDGRMQALSIAWDTRPAGEGGQRWFHLYPDESIAAGDELHWTRRNQNWNWMCADCHSTRLERNFDAASNTYATTYAEMNVACEACHGPGKAHVAWADAGASAGGDRGLVVALDERDDVHWTIDPDTGNAVRSGPTQPRNELAVCAQCHSRRAPFAEGMAHDGRLLDTHDISLLTEGLYFPDGQQQDEVYNVGSFMQSKMFAAGVTCSDCHDPHTGRPRAEGNAVCAQCHLPAKYDATAHTLHSVGSEGAQCASCHMPTRTYMGVDDRHDHSFRIPRPDLAAELGTPDACTSCHADRDAAWAANMLERQFGPPHKGFQTFGPVFHAARGRAPGAGTALMALAADPANPAIVRASALAHLSPYLSTATLPAIEAGASDPDPMVRGAAMDALLPAPPQERVRIAAGLIDDSSRLVRIKAARALAVAPDDGMAPAMRARLQKVFDEYVASQRANADRPESYINLGLFHAERRDPLAAEAAYRAALALEPDFTPAHLNLADLYRAHGREADVEATLAAGLALAPGDADLSHALGLLRVRQGRLADALPLLAQAADAVPENLRYAYVYGIALNDSGQPAQAIAELERALARFPNSPELLAALRDYSRAAGDEAAAAGYEKRLAQAVPVR